MISVRKLSEPGGDQRGMEHFLQRRSCAGKERYHKKYEAKENKYRGNMEEAPCGLIIRPTLQVPYSLTAVLYKFCHLVKTVRTTDPPFFSNWHFEAHSFNHRCLIALVGHVIRTARLS